VVDRAGQSIAAWFAMVRSGMVGVARGHGVGRDWYRQGRNGV
jgi:hypothetical protein